MNKITLSEKEYQEPRTPVEFQQWIRYKLDLFHQNEGIKNILRLSSNPLVKKFKEKIWPFNIVVQKEYFGRTDLFCVASINDKDNFDARITNNLQQPTFIEKFDITWIIYGKFEHKATEELILKGVSQINQFGDVQVAVDELLDRFKKTAAEKGKQQYRKGERVKLIVVLPTFFGRYFLEKPYSEQITCWIKKEIIPQLLNFKDLYVIDDSGGLYLKFII